MPESEPKYRDADWLREKYVDERLSTPKIGEICDVHHSTIQDWLNRHGIETRQGGPYTATWDEIQENFWEKVDTGDPDECWEWQATRIGRGYGQFNAARLADQSIPAHHIAYRIEYGEVGDKFVLHECDNPPCVNPNHLFTGTHEDNMRDMVEKGRQAIGSEVGNAKLTESEVVEIVERYSTGDETQSELAAEYDVSQSQIHKIVNGIRWGHATGIGDSDE